MKNAERECACEVEGSFNILLIDFEAIFVESSDLIAGDSLAWDGELDSASLGGYI